MATKGGGRMWRIYQADVLEWLTDYDGSKFHAVLSDPPYGLAFMDKSWDSFKTNADYQRWVTEWAELLVEKALYPGAVCLFFGGPRTWHRLACGLEDAGFEVNDTLMYLYGGGFPKGLDISKALDQEAGAEREVVGIRKHPTLKDASRVLRQNATQYHADNPIADEWPVTRPATDLAEKWAGYNTALKPAWEPIVLCRAPRNGYRYVDLVLEYGTGSLWIDGGRISISDDLMGGVYSGNTPQLVRNLYGDTTKLKSQDYQRPVGRWPANLMFSHLPECKMVGQQRIKLPALISPHLIPDDKLYGTNRSSGTGIIPSSDGETETVEIWECMEDCPVAMLDGQSGVTTSSGGIPEHIESMFFGIDTVKGHANAGGLGDTGGASRFFYTTRASRGERNDGLPEGGNNNHPTVKPLKITEYLARLILPPELDQPRRILIPFSGTGSEMIGAWRAGWGQVIGLEIDPVYVEVARHRLNYHTLQPKLL